MFQIPPSGMLVSYDDVLCFGELLLRWRYEVAIKIIKEVNSGNLTLYKVCRNLKDSNNKNILLISTLSVGYGDDANYLISLAGKLVFLVKEVETIEINNPLYTMTCNKSEVHYDFDLCTEDNIHRLAPQLLYAMCVHRGGVSMVTGKPVRQAHPILVRSTMMSNEKKLDLCPDGEKNSWTISKKTLFHIRTHEFNNTIKEGEIPNVQYVKSEIENAMAYETNDIIMLLKKALALNPKLTHASIGKLFLANKIHPTQDHEGQRTQGRRLMKKLKEADLKFYQQINEFRRMKQSTTNNT